MHTVWLRGGFWPSNFHCLLATSFAHLICMFCVDFHEMRAILGIDGVRRQSFAPAARKPFFFFFWGFVLAQYSLRLPVSPSIYQRIILQCLGFLYFVSVYSFCFLGNWDVGCCSGCCCWWCLPPLLLGMMLCVCFVLSLSLFLSLAMPSVGRVRANTNSRHM